MVQDNFQFALDPVAALESLVMDVLSGRRSPVSPLPDNARKVLYLLRGHNGPQYAKSLGSISASLGIADREIKSTVKTLREEFGIPIGANRQEPYGYYLCVTAEDRDSAIRPWNAEIISLARSVRAVGNRHQVQELLGQLQVELSGQERA